jgi:hypothetical protein
LRVGKIEADFGAVEPKLRAGLYPFEAQKATLEAIEILTHAELHGFDVSQVRFDDRHIGLYLFQNFEHYLVVDRLGHVWTLAGKKQKGKNITYI